MVPRPFPVKLMTKISGEQKKILGEKALRLLVGEFKKNGKKTLSKMLETGGEINRKLPAIAK